MVYRGARGKITEYWVSPTGPGGGCGECVPVHYEQTVSEGVGGPWRVEEERFANQERMAQQRQAVGRQCVPVHYEQTVR